MNFSRYGSIIVLLPLILTAITGAGCKTFFSEPKPPARIKIADSKQLDQDWLEITPPSPLKATAKIHTVGLKLKNIKGWADENQQKLRLTDGSEIKIEIELIDEKAARPFFFQTASANLSNSENAPKTRKTRRNPISKPERHLTRYVCEATNPSRRKKLFGWNLNFKDR